MFERDSRTDSNSSPSGANGPISLIVMVRQAELQNARVEQPVFVGMVLLHVNHPHELFTGHWQHVVVDWGDTTKGTMEHASPDPRANHPGAHTHDNQHRFHRGFQRESSNTGSSSDASVSASSSNVGFRSVTCVVSVQVDQDLQLAAVVEFLKN